MGLRKLKITIDPTGEVSVAVEGVAGASCTDASKFLEDALGGSVKSRELTSDYYATADATSETEIKFE